MASGKSLELRWMQFVTPDDRDKRDRDRSLNGKARRLARKIKNKETI